VVFFLLRKFLWKKFLGILDNRQAHIVGELKQIDDTKKEVSQLKDDFTSKLKGIEEIAAVRLKEVVKQGEGIAEDIKDRARQDAQRIVGEAKADIERTVVKTKEELKRQVVDMTFLATEKLLEEKITGDADRKLITQFIEQLDIQTSKEKVWVPPTGEKKND
jgi:F-type H+-transporting ATPase subunit b